MPKLVIRGKNRLAGKITVQGSKNSSLPIIAATLLAGGEYHIDNVPDILDVRKMLGILKDLGSRVDFTDSKLIITTADRIDSGDMPDCRKLRASILMMGVLMGRRGCFDMPYPGGCRLGTRPVNYHIAGLKQYGAMIEETESSIFGKCDSLTGCEYTFAYPSIGALENMILAGVLATGSTILNNCAKEPEVCDLCDFLRKMGAKIYGDGTDTIVIEGVDKLTPADYVIPGDRIVAGTYMIACAAVGGNILIQKIEPRRVRYLTKLLKKTGCHVFTDSVNNEIITLADGGGRAVPYICARPYPEFPTDLQPQTMVLLSVLHGSSKLKDEVFVERYGTAKELAKMGADIQVEEDGVYIKGSARLTGTTVKAGNLRQGAALVIAALAADGITIIEECRHIMRGYEDIARDMRRLGADIVWKNETENVDISG